MIDKLKEYLIAIFATVSTVLGVWLFFEKNKLKIDEALVNDQKLNTQLNSLDKVIDQNNVQLDNEEQKRKELEDANQDVSKDPSDTADYFNKRTE